MGLIWLALAAIAVWALVRLGRQSEKPGRGQWRIAATVLGAVLLAGAVLAGSHGAWLATAGMVGAGLYLIFSSRIRANLQRAAPKAARPEALSEAEARSILGVGPTATKVEINEAWRRLMGRAHPDQGGTEGLAARVNSARDRLLRR
ncbi:J domain-containing protein [Brevundimonas goettingensis]|uniref:Molecular chaperone DnaJ n=1 Tax=Brevundimonas goettingensis TaxID=2774190 RepID=A0A975GWX9_9CAUL|nr:molecular chaperone DnaJ [Brevundimonas goettingensis]QTC93116.1 molecular chaperone DnaJ [Brevundimonas goettingensis]